MLYFSPSSSLFLLNPDTLFSRSIHIFYTAGEQKSNLIFISCYEGRDGNGTIIFSSYKCSSCSTSTLFSILYFIYCIIFSSYNFSFVESRAIRFRLHNERYDDCERWKLDRESERNRGRKIGLDIWIKRKQPLHWGERSFRRVLLENRCLGVLSSQNPFSPPTLSLSPCSPRLFFFLLLPCPNLHLNELLISRSL